MNLRGRSTANLLITASLAALVTASCGDQYSSQSDNAGGISPSAGTGSNGTPTGGTVARGGAPTAGAPVAGSTSGGVSSTAPQQTGGQVIDATGGATAAATGGAVGSGGVAASGAAPSTTVATGGTTTTSAGGCGTTPSTFNEQITSTATTLQKLSDNVPTSSLTLGSNAKSPASNPSLCNNDCIALSGDFPVSSGTMNVRVARFFSQGPYQNLLGSTITASIAIENPNAVPVRVVLFAGGDASTNWQWGNTAEIAGTKLASYAAATGFHDLSVTVKDNGAFCASSAYYYALWLENQGAVTTASTVTVYIKKITVAPQGSVSGTGGAPGTGGASGAAGRSGTSGGGTSGASGSTGAGGTSGSSTTASASGTAGAAGSGSSSATSGGSGAAGAMATSAGTTSGPDGTAGSGSLTAGATS